MLDTFVADFLRLALADDRGAEVAAGLSNPEQEALHEAVGRLHRFLQVDDFSGSLVAPLLRAQLEVDELPLDDGTRIERFTDQLRRELWSSHGWGSLSLSPLPAEEVLSAEHVISIDVTGKRLGGWDWWKAQQQVPRVLLALRLTAPGSVAAPWFMLRPQSEFSDYLVSLGVGGGLVSEPLRDVHRDIFRLDESQASSVAETFRHLISEPPSKPLALALRRFTSSYQRDAPQDRLVDFWIAFEALFAPDQTDELRFRASLRIARLIGSTEAERRSLFAAMRSSYDWRSHIVHGGSDSDPKKVKKLGDLSETLAVTEDALRRALRRFVDPSSRPSIQNIDAAFLK